MSLCSPRSQPPGAAMDPGATISTIEWEMMDKMRFCSLTMLNSFTIRGLLYPFTVIKTRLQVQRHREVYSGTFDAFLKIVRYEGIAGLYKGFWVNSIQIGSGFAYITTYEKVRHLLGAHTSVQGSSLRGLIAGGMGSLVSQTIITPFDVVSQHLMLHGHKSRLGTLHVDYTRRHGLAFQIIKTLYRKDGLRGFYRGYFASICCYVPTSALWWMFYPVYSEVVASLVPEWTSLLAIHAMAGPMSGVTVACLTNPLDVIRAKIQVQRLDSFSQAARLLWEEEQLRALTKGLSARLLQSSISSFFIVLGYESLKRFSLQECYKDQVRW